MTTITCNGIGQSIYFSTIRHMANQNGQTHEVLDIMSNSKWWGRLQVHPLNQQCWTYSIKTSHANKFFTWPASRNVCSIDWQHTVYFCILEVQNSARSIAGFIVQMETTISPLPTYFIVCKLWLIIHFKIFEIY